ncbi:MAG: metallophosphoesterase family protein [Candidatus Omnitrophica bacterium]|nr:metallophosphoesterase family protein [Candidatus Omnitrophota bacterium]
MMRLGILSDTHNQPIPSEVLEELRHVDLIIHAGDICDEATLSRLQSLAKVCAVCGNMDDGRLRQKLSETQVIQVENMTVGVFHGVGPASRVVEFVREKFAGQKVDAVIFGHSHQPFQEKIDGILYFNPGSPNDHVCAPYCSYGIMEIHDGKIEARIVKC